MEDLLFDIRIDSPRAADKFEQRLRSKFGLLADFPLAGSSRPDIGPAARILVQGKHLIIHEVTDELVTILRVVHGARDLDEL